MKLYSGFAYGKFDNKWVYIMSIIIFETGSAICGGAPNMDALIVGRAIAGVGGAGQYLGSVWCLFFPIAEHIEPSWLMHTFLEF